MPVSAPGSAGMETCLVNLVEPGDEVLICVNGVFGGRMKSIVERMGAKPVVVNDDWGHAVDPNKVEEALKAADQNNFQPVYKLLEVLKVPYNKNKDIIVPIAMISLVMSSEHLHFSLVKYLT